MACGKAFRALADPTRRQILRLLKDGPQMSGDIADAFDSSWATISRHLALLREAELVVAEKEKREIYYMLNTSVFDDLVHHLRLVEWVRPSRVSRRSVMRRKEA
jgi:DNA-binding transcriptional ArsR family regulator